MAVKMCLYCLRKMNSEDGQVYSFLYCNYLLLLSTTVYSQNINKQFVSIADETLDDLTVNFVFSLKLIFQLRYMNLNENL